MKPNPSAAADPIEELKHMRDRKSDEDAAYHLKRCCRQELSSVIETLEAQQTDALSELRRKIEEKENDY